MSPADRQQKTIAVLGASSQRHKFGNKCVRAFTHAGWRVVPVNPAGGEIEGLSAVRRLAEIEMPLDRISVYLPPAVSLHMLDEIGAQGAGEVWFNPGSADDRVLEQARSKGIPAVDGCSIVDIGLSPAQFP